MKRLILIDGYKSKLNLMDTEIAIKLIKDNFERKLADALNLVRVSAPLFVLPKTGLNDELNGYERRVAFNIKNINDTAEIVQSLAKWKRNALKKYSFKPDSGLYTDMNAIRCDEDLDNMHSAYVDQWDWERIITKNERKLDFLKSIVSKIYDVLLSVEMDLYLKYDCLKPVLPKELSFITSEELLKMYPDKDASERERLYAKKHGACFIIGIGDKLSNGKAHDGRAADYDDWHLNGDLIVYYDLLDIAFEISSMGIRVDENSIKYQLNEKNENHKLENDYVKGIINKTLPLTIGGGIGQSRLCMFLLKKAHIGEVQTSIWPSEDLKKLEEKNIHLL